MNITVKPLYTGLLGERKLARYRTTRYTSIERFTWSQFLVNNRSSVSYTYILHSPLLCQILKLSPNAMCALENHITFPKYQNLV